MTGDTFDESACSTEVLKLSVHHVIARQLQFNFFAQALVGFFSLTINCYDTEYVSKLILLLVRSLFIKKISSSVHLARYIKCYIESVYV